MGNYDYACDLQENKAGYTVYVDGKVDADIEISTLNESLYRTPEIRTTVGKEAV